jgi:myxalamid-type polyketide synthase MxaB
MEADNHERRAAQGLGLIDPQRGVAILERLIRQQAVQVTALPVQWQQFLGQLPSGGLATFFGKLHTAGGTPAQTGWREQLAALPLNERRAWLTTQIRSTIAQILGAGTAEEIPLRQGLFELGLDSLMALELRQRLTLRSGYALRQTFVFDYPMVNTMVDYFSQNAFPELFQPTEPSGAGQAQSTLTEDLMEISDAEAEALLIAALEQINH